MVIMYCKLTLLFFLLAASATSAQGQVSRATADRGVQLEDVYGRNTFQVKSIGDFRFSSGGKYFYRTSADGNLLKFALNSGTVVDTVISSRRLSQQKVSIGRYLWNTSEDLLLLHSQRKSIYRFSFTSIPWIYDLSRDSLFQLTDRPVSNVSFCPTGDRIVYCRDNNIFIYEYATGKEIQITDSPSQGMVKNGVSDWVYEETFGVVRAYKWSGDGRYLAYYKFDVSRVPEHGFPVYDAGTDDELYRYRYYRPGEPLSEVGIYIYDAETTQTRVGVQSSRAEFYYPRIYWSGDNRSLFVYKTPRDQKTLEIGQVDAEGGTYRTILTDTDHQYIDRATFDAFYSFSDGNRFIYMSEKEGWRRLYLVDSESGDNRVLTPFQYDTDRLMGVDEKRSRFYCSVAENPLERQVLAIGISSGLVTPLTVESGWNTLTFNRTFDYYLKRFSTIALPPLTTLHDADGQLAFKVEDNASLLDTMRSFQLSEPLFLKIPNRNGIELNAWMLLPPHYEGTRKYPVVFANYGGPGSQRVANRWGMVNFWYQHLAQQGIIVVCVDNTGTGYRGAAFKKAVYGKLGIQEIEDQMDAAKWLSAQYQFIDHTRLAYWGWSYGGFMASMAITYGADVFSTAIAVAPVTDWRLYQSGYAERHMGLLKDNPVGYAKSTPMAYIDRMKGNFFLIHGTADDNVPFRNSAVFSSKLINAGKQFEQFYYPDKNHAISGTHTRFYLYRQMTDYLIDKLQPR